jgi:sulfur-oxidizing protein SoxY
MRTNQKRRLFLKYLLVNSAITTTFCAGLLRPRVVLASWPKSAFEAATVPDALNSLFGTSETTKKKWLTKIDVRPHLDDGGTQVTVSITTKITDVDSITILTPNNPQPLVATYKFGNKAAVTSLQTRIKMEAIGDVIAIVKSGERLFSEATEVDFTGCGCG